MLVLGVDLYEDIVFEKDGEEIIRICGCPKKDGSGQARNKIGIELPKDISVRRVPAKER